MDMRIAWISVAFIAFSLGMPGTCPGQDVEWDVATSWCIPSACYDFKSGLSWQISMSNVGICHNGAGVNTWAGSWANCTQLALGDGRAYGAVYTALILIEGEFIERQIGGLMSVASGTAYDGRSSYSQDEHYCDGYRETWSDPPVWPC